MTPRGATLAFAVLVMTLPGHSECISINEATKHIGETRCVRGKVVRVKQGSRGTYFFDFCEDYRLCPFTVVVFASDLKNVGDVRQLQGREVEVHGDIKQYDGRAEIILSRARQLGGESARIPPLPKDYDVEKKGRYSPGSFSYPKSRKPAKKRQPARVQTEEQVDPMDQTDN